MKPYFVAAALLAMLSCQQPASNQSENERKDSSAVTPATQTAVNGPQCYTRISGKDTSYLQFATAGETINGQLEYRLFEKDRNQGTITGKLSNNIIEAEYTFMSEGTTSVRPVVFKVENDQVFEALPSSLDAQGNPVFDKDQSKLKFEDAPFIKGACK